MDFGLAPIRTEVPDFVRIFNHFAHHGWGRFPYLRRELRVRVLIEMRIRNVARCLLQGFCPVFSAIIFALDNWSPLLQKRIVVAALALFPFAGCLPDVFLISAARDDRTIDASSYDVDVGLIRRCRGKVFCSVALFRFSISALVAAAIAT